MSHPTRQHRPQRVQNGRKLGAGVLARTRGKTLWQAAEGRKAQQAEHRLHRPSAEVKPGTMGQ